MPSFLRHIPAAILLLGVLCAHTEVSASGFIQSMQLHERAMKARKAGDLPAAIQAAEAELRVVEEQMAGASIHLGRVLPFLGELYLEAGRFDDATKAYVRAIGLRIEEVGVGSGDVASLRSRLGECRLGQSKVEEAIQLFEQAITVYEDKGKTYDLARASTLEKMAKALEGSGKQDQSNQRRREALKIYGRTWGADDERTAAAKKRLFPGDGP